jgi:dUTP pyrophosphatase
VRLNKKEAKMEETITMGNESTFSGNTFVGGTSATFVISPFDSINNLRVKKLDPAAVLPSRAQAGDVGYDVVALEDGKWDESGTFIEYKTGLAIEVPVGYHTELFPRSSVSKYDLILANSIGLVDNGYRGEIRFRFKYIPRFVVEDGVLQQQPPLLYKKGDKIVQIVVRQSCTHLSVKEVDELSDTARGSGGFGSTGR